MLLRAQKIDCSSRDLFYSYIAFVSTVRSYNNNKSPTADATKGVRSRVRNGGLPD